MDRNTIIGLVLIAGIFLTWSIFFNRNEEPDPNKKKAPQTQVDSIGVDTVKVDSQAMAEYTAPTDNGLPNGMTDSLWQTLSDSERTVLMAQEDDRKYGYFGELRKGENKIVRVETDELIAEIQTKGGYMRSLYLKNDSTYGGEPLPIIAPSDSNYLALRFAQLQDVQFPLVNTADLYFSADADEVNLSGGDEKSVTFRAQIDDQRFFEYVYTFRGAGYDYGFEIRHNGLTGIARGQDIRLNWGTVIPKTEKAMALMREKTAIYYRKSGDVDNLQPRGEEVQEEFITSGVDWFAFKSQFFSHTLMTADEATTMGDMNLAQANPVPPDPEDVNSGEIVKIMVADVALNFGYEESGSAKYTFFAGPCDYDVLNDYERDMIYQIELGYGPLKLVNRYLVIPMFNFLEGFISSYGIIILLLAFFIKMILYPLTYRTYRSTAKMRIINQTPEVKALEEKYKDDSTKLQQEKMGIYRKMGVSMLGGCWPMLLQYPFLIALFFFFPNSIELRGESFLWADDLSTYDSILELGFEIPFYGDHVSLFTLLMTVSIFAFTLINQRAQGTMTTNPVMKYFPYFMPVIFLGFLNNYSAGLSWYYLISNLISISQTVLTKRFIDEDALLTQMREKSKKRAASGKKSRMERWMDQQQKKQKQVQASRAGSNGSSNGSARGGRRGGGGSSQSPRRSGGKKKRR
ncbi:MAG: membrane protein insertase YidC [Bacteroidota bacterium]